MSRFAEWVSRHAQQWIVRFKQRHGLAAAATHAPLQADNLPKPPGQRCLLHVGCGYATMANIAVPGFRLPGAWREIRLDADESVLPDIVGSMTDMHAVPDGHADAVFSSHGIEHLYWHDVPAAMHEFLRVLAADGFVVIACPDLQAAAQMIAEDRLFETAYHSQAGPITPFDIVYSYRPFVAANPQWMSHHCGFTLSTLTDTLRQAGFASIHGFRRPRDFDLWVVASKSPRDVETMTRLAAEYLPPQA